jgi:hypothetical protein
LLPQLAKEANTSPRERLSEVDYVDASSDGWRKKSCEQGASLNNVMALLPDRSLFHDAVNVSQMRKHAPAIKEFLINSTKSMMGDSEEDMSRFCGWVLDNTKANWKAMLSIEEEHPAWIMRGCFAHGVALLMKDFAQPKAAVGKGAPGKRTGMVWAQRTVSRANTISNYIQDCGGAKSEVKHYALNDVFPHSGHAVFFLSMSRSEYRYVPACLQSLPSLNEICCFSNAFMNGQHAVSTRCV